MPNKKWIVFINHKSYPCNIGGIEVFNYYLINELSKSYNIHVLTLCDKTKYSNKITVHIIKKLFFSKFTQPFLTFLFLIKNRKNISLLHISFSKAYWSHWFVYVIVKKILDIKYIITIHGGSLAKWQPKWPYKLFFKYAEFITGVSDRIMTEYKKRSNREIIFTPPLIPFDIITPKNKFRDKWSINDDDFVFLYVGSIKPLKAVDSLIEAIGLLPKEIIQRKNLKVLIAGDGESRNKLEMRVKDLELNSSIKFLGNVKREEVPELYNLANMYTICSEFEGLPVSLLEAFANELPCITSDAPGLINVSLNNKNTLLFKTRDTHDYAKKIETLLRDKQLQNKMKNNAKTYFNKYYSYKILVNDFKEIIDKIV